MIHLWIIQILFFLTTLVFFNTAILQSQFNVRIQGIEAYKIYSHFQSFWITDALVPWIIFSIIGVGLAYFSIVKGQTPLLQNIVLPRPNHQKSHFYHNYFSIVIQMVTQSPYFFLMCFSIILLGEFFAVTFGLSSILKYSIRSSLAWFMIMLVFRKRNMRFVEWQQENKVSMGGRLVFYVLILAAILTIYHAFWEYLSIPEIPGGESNFKSPMVGAFVEENVNIRISLMMLGWWTVWIPWMAAFIARYSIGFSIGQALINSLLVPVITLYSCSTMSNSNWRFCVNFLESPLGKFAGALLCLMMLWISLKNTYNFSDFSRGAMLPIGKLPKRAIKKDVSVILLCVLTYLPCAYLLGWVPAQVIVTLGAIFMLSVVSGFIIVLTREYLINKIIS